jgi:Ca2+-binding EF-hand superfamily protein
MPDDYWKELLEDADRDGDGEINEEEFMRIMRRVEEIGL